MIRVVLTEIDHGRAVDREVHEFTDRKEYEEFAAGHWRGTRLLTWQELGDMTRAELKEAWGWVWEESGELPESPSELDQLSVDSTVGRYWC